MISILFTSRGVEMYDPIKLSELTERIVVRGAQRKYHRFRFTRFYGGSATADAVGCNLRCIFCWSGRAVRNPSATGKFYSPEIVADMLIDMAERNGCRIIRISGAEPTIGKAHLLSLLDVVDVYDKIFILETNGILIGADRRYAEELSGYKRLHVRVSIKGCSEDEFRYLTGAKYGFSLQLKSLEYLSDNNVSFHPSVVSTRGENLRIVEKLKELGIRPSDIEWERLKLYPPVKERLKRMGRLDEMGDIWER